MAGGDKFSKYERARIIGARGLQISMDAPLLIDIKEDELEKINYDPLKIAEKELDEGVLPISINKPMPAKKEEPLEKVKIEESDITDAQKIAVEKEIEKEILEESEMSEFANPIEESEKDEIPDEEEMEE